MKRKLFVILLCILIVSMIGISLVACNSGTYTVSFETNGGSSVAQMKAKKGGKVNFTEEYSIPVKEGYTFAGWKYYNGNDFKNDDIIYEDTTLYAKWEINEYNVIVSKNNEKAGEIVVKVGEENASVQKFSYNTEVTAKVEKIYKGYDFIGWFKGDVLCSEGKEYSFSVSTDIALVAKFAVKSEFADFGFVSNENELTIISYKGSNDNISIPFETTAIGKEAFSGKNGIAQVSIPDTVTKIGDSAFESCYNLNTIEISDSVKEIGSYAFADCHNLTAVNLPIGITEIKPYTFYNCKKLCDISISNGIKIIGRGAFQFCGNLNKIVLPETLETIGKRAFYMCYALEEIIIPLSVIVMENEAFYMNSSGMVIKCRANEKPSGWDDQWKYYSGTVEWGYADGQN